jgi:hypothetical protein
MKQSTTMRSSLWWALLAAAVLALPGLIYAQSLGEKQQRKQNDEILQSAAKDMNEECRTSIRATWDWPSFKGKLTRDSYWVGLNCGVGLGDMKGLCQGDDESKVAIKAGIKTFVCKGGGGKTGKVHLDKKTKTLYYSTSLEVETQFKIADYLRENL